MGDTITALIGLAVLMPILLGLATITVLLGFAAYHTLHFVCVGFLELFPALINHIAGTGYIPDVMAVTPMDPWEAMVMTGIEKEMTDDLYAADSGLPTGYGN